MRPDDAFLLPGKGGLVVRVWVPILSFASLKENMPEKFLQECQQFVAFADTGDLHHGIWRDMGGLLPWRGMVNLSRPAISSRPA